MLRFYGRFRQEISCFCCLVPQLGMRKNKGSAEKVFMVPGENVHLCLKKKGWGGGEHAAAVPKGYRDVHCCVKAKPISQKDLHADWFY